MRNISALGIGFSGIVYLLVGGFGYATYGSKTKSNFILNFTPEDIEPYLYILLNTTYWFIYKH